MIKKEDFDLEDFDQELSDCLERMGFNEETKQKCADLFYDAIEQRLFHQDDEFRQNLAELLNDYTPNPFIVLDERIDVVQMLANRIQELETDLEMVEQEKQELIEDIKQLTPFGRKHLRIKVATTIHDRRNSQYS